MVTNQQQLPSKLKIDQLHNMQENPRQTQFLKENRDQKAAEYKFFSFSLILTNEHDSCFRVFTSCREEPLNHEQ
jgi:hypothetical protein